MRTSRMIDTEPRPSGTQRRQDRSLTVAALCRLVTKTALFLALATPALADDRPAYVTTLFHFNIQYVAGHNATEDAIVRESFDPLLRLYEAHPDWGADFEMQAYMVEVLAKRHPETLERFRKLVASGQVELVCCHYSDQLVLAYPREDQERSVALVDKVLAAHGLARCGVVFAQEGQTGPGFLEFMHAHGYPIAVHASGSYDYFQPCPDPPPLYLDGKTLVLPTDSNRKDAPASLTWGRLGDGELVVADGNPYEIKGKFGYSAAKAAGFENSLDDRAAAGAHLVTITRYVAEMQRLQVKPEPIGPYLDTAWKGDNANNIFCWLGSQIAPYERDVEIASANYALSRELLAVEVLTGDAARLERAWKYLLLAEVSDAAGWVPVPAEVAYAEKMQSLCGREIAAVLRETMTTDEVAVDLATKRIVPAPTAAPPIADEAPGLAISATAGKRALATSWKKFAPDRWRLTVEVSVGETESTAVDVVFPLLAPEIVYSPACADDRLVRVACKDLRAPRCHLALPNGIIGLGEDWYVVKHNRANHVACRIDAAAKDVRFRNDTAPTGKREWRFEVVHGPAARVIDIAKEINTAPVIVLRRP